MKTKDDLYAAARHAVRDLLEAYDPDDVGTQDVVEEAMDTVFDVIDDATREIERLVKGAS
jgi:hypothetical protein